MSARHRKRKRDYTARDWRRLIARTEVKLATETDQRKRNVLDRRIRRAQREIGAPEWVAKLRRNAHGVAVQRSRRMAALEANQAEAQRL